MLPIKARPGAKADAVLGEHGGALKVSVTAAPEKGKANAAIGKLLASSLGVKTADVRLVRGASSSSKVFLVAGIGRAQVLERLQKLLAE